MTRLPLILLLISCAAAQDKSGRLQFDWDKLAAKAVEKVDLNLEAPMLEMASKFLGSTGDDAKFKQAVQGLKGVFVKSFTFDKEGEYSQADVASLRSQLRSPEWSKILDVQEKRESTGIYIKG